MDIQGGSVNLSSSLYPFFCWSQLTDESKGGYLTGTIKVPEGTKKIELSLSTKFGLPHPNLLFVTPSIKQSGEKPKDITAQNYNVILEITDENELQILPLSYWPTKSRFHKLRMFYIDQRLLEFIWTMPQERKWLPKTGGQVVMQVLK